MRSRVEFCFEFDDIESYLEDLRSGADFVEHSSAVPQIRK